MADIKTRPAMDTPKALNRDFVPKEAGSIWKAHHDQQEAQRGPKERGSIQYATDQVETTGRRSALAAADGGRRAIRQIKKRHDRGEPVGRKKTATEPKKNNPSADGAYQSSPYDSYYPAYGGTGQDRLSNSAVWSWAGKKLWRIILKVLLSQKSTAALKCRAPG